MSRIPPECQKLAEKLIRPVMQIQKEVFDPLFPPMTAAAEDESLETWRAPSILEWNIATRTLDAMLRSPIFQEFQDRMSSSAPEAYRHFDARLETVKKMLADGKAAVKSDDGGDEWRTRAIRAGRNAACIQLKNTLETYAQKHKVIRKRKTPEEQDMFWMQDDALWEAWKKASKAKTKLKAFLADCEKGEGLCANAAAAFERLKPLKVEKGRSEPKSWENFRVRVAKRHNKTVD